jgi:photosystem II stability/assembly factor-like uncharacterized protein
MNRISLILASILTISTLATSQTWTSLNSPAGFKNVQEIAVSYRGGNGDTMYAADELKLLKSVNGGQSWSATTTEIAGAVAVTCKYDDQGIVVASGPAFFSRSTNGGSSWSTPSITYNTNKPTVLADFPNNTAVMLLGKKYYSTSEKSIAKSTDGGASWSYTLSSSYKTKIFDIAINVSSAYPAMAIAAGCAVDGTVNDKGLYYTENYGDTWTARVTSTGGGWTAVAFRYHSATENQDTVYAGTADGGLYRSIWKASSMTLLKTFPDTVRSITIHPDSTWVIFVTTDRSVYKSTDKGSTWNNYITGLLDTRSFVLKYKPGTSSNMLVGSRGYLYRTTNYGTNWSSIGSTTTRTLPMASVASGGAKAFAGSGELTVGFNFDGSTWNSVRVGQKDSIFFTNHSSNLYNGSSKRVIFHAGVGDNTSSVYRSVDTGNSFNPIQEFKTLTKGTYCSGISQDPSYPQVLFAYGYLMDGENVRDFFKSTDYGATWTKSTSTVTTSNGWLSFQILGDGSGSASQYMYSGVDSGGGSGGIYRSTNGGSSWERVDGNIGDADITTITNQPNLVGYVYAGGARGLWFSSSATAATKDYVVFTNKWSTADVKKVVIDPRFRNSAYGSASIFFVGSNNTIYRSENNGTTSASVLGDLPAGSIVNDLRTDPYDSTLLYIATDRGAYKAQLAATPSLTTPAHNIEGLLWCLASTEPMTLTWSSITSATKYFIQIDNNSDFNSTEFNDSTVSAQYTISTDLAEGMSYYWRVRSVNGFGYSPWSGSFRFKTQVGNADTLLAAPALSSPSNGATGVSLNPTLSWNAVNGAVKYKVVVQGVTTKYTTTTSTQISGLSHNTTYNWNVTAIDCYPSNPSSGTWSFTTQDPYRPGGVAAHGEMESDLPKEHVLMQNYPNPFNPVTHFRYGLPTDAYVRLRVYNALGQEVATLVDGSQSAGWKEIEYNGSKIPSGVYFYRIDAGSFISIKKMMLLK